MNIKLKKPETVSDVELEKRRPSHVMNLKEHLKKLLKDTKKIAVSIDGKFQMISSMSVVKYCVQHKKTTFRDK